MANDETPKNTTGMSENPPAINPAESAEPPQGPMRFVKNPFYYNIALYVFLVVAASIAFYEILKNSGAILRWLGNAASILQPVVIGLVLAYLLNPLLRLFDDSLLPRVAGKKLRRRTRRGWAILLTYLAAALIVGGFLAIVLPQLVDSIRSIFNYVPSFVQTVVSWYTTLEEWLRGIGLLPEGAVLVDVGKLMEQVTSPTTQVLEGVYSGFSQMLPTAFRATTRLTTVLLNIVLGVIISIYLLSEREKFFAQLKKLMTAVFPARFNTVVYEIAHESHSIFQGFIVGKIIDSFIIGIICYAGMLVLRLEYPLLIAVIVGVTNIIPYFGPFIGAIPGTLLLYIVNPRQALWFLIFIFLLQQFDGNILGPKILGDTIGISAFWVIFAITLFSGMIGIMGMFIGVPLFALIYSLVKRFASYLLRRKGESVNTRDYDSETNPLLK